jgi:hypothetical protein
MKAKNMKVGLEVIIKPNATGNAADFIGQKGEIVEWINPEVCWVMVGEDKPPIRCIHWEIKKAKTC